MFHRTRPIPTKSKHVVYLISATVLGVILSCIVHAIIETLYLNSVKAGEITRYQGCSLHPVIQVGLPILGAVGGLFLGRFWWKIVYIEQSWRKK
ncbi:MAG: hypothetical protein V1853_04010 [bacterium]